MRIAADRGGDLGDMKPGRKQRRSNNIYWRIQAWTDTAAAPAPLTNCMGSGIARGGRGTAPGGNQERRQKWGDKGVSGMSRLLGAAKLQSAPGADNPHYAAE